MSTLSNATASIALCSSLHVEVYTISEKALGDLIDRKMMQVVFRSCFLVLLYYSSSLLLFFFTTRRPDRPQDDAGTRKVDSRLPGKGDSNSHGARPVC